MISFDDLGGGSSEAQDLQPIYNSLNYLLNCCSSVQGSISALDGSVSYCQNSINSLVSDISSIWNYVSTISGGGGEGENVLKSLPSNYNTALTYWFVNSIDSDVQLPNGTLNWNIATIENAFNSRTENTNQDHRFNDITLIKNCFNANNSQNITFKKDYSISSAYNSNRGVYYSLNNTLINEKCFADNNFANLYFNNMSWSHVSFSSLSSFVLENDCRRRTFNNPVNISTILTTKATFLIRNGLKNVMSIGHHYPTGIRVDFSEDSIGLNYAFYHNTLAYIYEAINNVNVNDHGHDNSFFEFSRKAYYCNFSNELYSNLLGYISNSAMYLRNVIMMHGNNYMSQIVNYNMFNSNASAFFNNTASTMEIANGGVISNLTVLNSNSCDVLNVVMPNVMLAGSFGLNNTFESGRIALNNKISVEKTTFSTFCSLFNNDLEYNVRAVEENIGFPSLFYDYQTKTKTIHEEIGVDMDILRLQKLNDNYHNLTMLNNASFKDLKINEIEVGRAIGEFQYPINHYDAYYIDSHKPILKDATFCYFKQHGLLNYAEDMPRLSWACISKSGGNFENGTEWLSYAMGLNWSVVLSRMPELKRLDIFYAPSAFTSLVQIQNFRNCYFTKLNINISYDNNMDKHFKIGPSAFVKCNIRDFNFNIMGHTPGAEIFTYLDSYAFSDCTNLRDINLDAVDIAAYAFYNCAADNFYIRYSNISKLSNPQQWKYPVNEINKINLYVVGDNDSQTITNSDLTAFATFFGPYYTRLKINNIYDQGF